MESILSIPLSFRLAIWGRPRGSLGTGTARRPVGGVLLGPRLEALTGLMISGVAMASPIMAAALARALARA